MLAAVPSLAVERMQPGCSVSSHCPPRAQSQRLCSRRASAVRGRASVVTFASAERSFITLNDVTLQPAGVGEVLLQNVSLGMPEKGLGLIVGRSGSGKTTLLTMLAGLTEPQSGSISIGSDGLPTPAAARLPKVGLVFQFPERHFLGSTVKEELTFGWPRGTQGQAKRMELATRLSSALEAVGMSLVRLDTPVRALSGGYQRRLALALQLMRGPQLLLLDEPLAGLDWRTRGELVPLLAKLKRERAVLVVTHDLRELLPAADFAWRMAPGGRLEPEDLGALAQRVGKEGALGGAAA